MDTSILEDLLKGGICRTCQMEIIPNPNINDMVTCESCQKILAGRSCQYCLEDLEPTQNEPQSCDSCRDDR